MQNSIYHMTGKLHLIRDLNAIFLSSRISYQNFKILPLENATF